MPFSSSNTGSTDLRLTEVQQPNTAATLSFCRSSRAFSANNGQFDAGSTTTASSLRPSTPPFLFCSSISISMTSFKVVSLIAIVPDSECRIPILIGGACANAPPAIPASRPAATRPVRMIEPNFIPLLLASSTELPAEGRGCESRAKRRRMAGIILVGDQHQSPARQNHAAQGAQSQVAEASARNPAESQTEALKEGGRDEEPQDVVAGVAGRCFQRMGIAMKQGEQPHHVGGPRRRLACARHDEGPDRENRRQDGRLCKRQFYACKTGSCPNGHHHDE